LPLSVYTASPTAAYRQQSILTAPPGQLVVMLYDGCLRFLGQAAYALRDGDAGEADARLARAEAIIDELLATLDLEQGGEIASRLQGIYVFCSRHLLDARSERDPEMIDKVAELLGELRDAWAQIATA
jgi:flagellar protein FliS